MNRMHRMLLLIATLLTATIAVDSYAAVSLNALDGQVRKLREKEAVTWKQREARFRDDLQKQEKQTRDMVARRNALEQRGKVLGDQSEKNFAHIDELSALLRQHQGNLGELFGVTRQIAGDAANVLRSSMLTVQFPPAEGQESRADFMARLAGAKELPNIMELERMWFELHREMTETGKTVKFRTLVITADGSQQEMDVVRVGPFIASADGQYLVYGSNAEGHGEFALMERQPGMGMRRIAANLENDEGTGYRQAVVDPARGALMGLVVQRPNFIERIQHGEVVGYVIVAVGILGVILAMFQYVHLFLARTAVAAQLRNLSSPSGKNPLGRVLLAFRNDGKPIANPELVELRLSEAVLRELPRLQRFQGFLRLCVAAGPLLGLIGTVIGMIITFHAITASGSSDPKLMAHGIGQAMIATVLGLGIAIPLLFINAGLTTLSNGVTSILDEQTQSLLAEDLIGRRQEELA